MTIWRSVFIWLGCLMYGLPVPRVEVWQGATVGWSPQASVASVQSVAAWDVVGWADKSQRQLHKRLDGIEARLHNQLDQLLADVYEWRDAV